MKLHDWQTDNHDAMVSAIRQHGVVADASRTGAGKTVMSLLACKTLGLRPFVVCPKQTIPSWTETMERIGHEPHAINPELLKSWGLKKKPNPFGIWQIRNRTWRWNLPPDGILIWDEVHNCGGYSSANSKLLKTCKIQGTPLMMLSATLATTPIRMRAIGFNLGICPFEWEAWQGWALQNGCHFNDYGALAYTDNQRSADRAIKRIRNLIGDKLTGITDVSKIPGYPENQIIPWNVTTTQNPDKAFADLIQAKKDAAEYDITELQIAWQEAEGMKIKAVVDHARTLIDAGLRVVIMPVFHETSRRIAEALQAPSAYDDYPVQPAIKAFQAGNPAVVISQSKGGTGVDGLQDTGQGAVNSIIFPNYNSVNFVQSCGRIHRSNSESPCVQYIPFSAKSRADQDIRKRLEHRLNDISTLTDNDFRIS